MSATVSPQDRFTRHTQDCPVCGGNRDDRPGRDTRCYGHYSDERRWAICTRDNHAGRLQPNANGHYRHRLDGLCACGEPHGGPGAEPQAKPADSVGSERPRALYQAIAERLRDGQRFVARWDYRDADGRFVYTVARYDPVRPDQRKQYRPWQPVGDRWAMDEDGLTRLLYRLPELLASSRLGRIVFIVEGEKCVEALRGVGLVATTSPGGAQKWHTVPGRHDALRGRHVVILADNDPDGRAHVLQVAADLTGVAASAHALELPDLGEKGDIADWLASGHTALELVELAYALAHAPAAGAAADTPHDPGEPPPLHEAVAIERRHNQVLERRNAWQDKWRANPHFSAPVKMTGDVLHQMLADLPAHGPKRITRAALSRRLGVKPGTITNHLQLLADGGAIVKELDRTTGPDGMPRSTLYVTATPEFLSAPDALTLERERNGWGGKRLKTCPACDSANVVTRLELVCLDCGNIEPLRPDEPANPTQEEQAGNTPPGQDSCPGSQDASTGQEGVITVAFQGGETTPETINTTLSDMRAILSTTEPPRRACLRCGEECWRWDGQRWVPGCQDREVAS